MEFLTEFLIEFLLEGSIELGTNKKVPVFIRYPLLFLILISILLVLGGIFLGKELIKYDEKEYMDFSFSNRNGFIFNSRIFIESVSCSSKEKVKEKVYWYL